MEAEFRALNLNEAFDVNLSDYLLEDINISPILPQVASATPVVQPPRPVASETGLTRTEEALLSPAEKIIRQRTI